MSAQTVYRFSTPIGQAGGIYDLAPYEVNSFMNESADGALKFGMGVVQGATPGKGIAVPTSSALPPSSRVLSPTAAPPKMPCSAVSN